MLAIRQHAFGGPEELRLEEVPDPHPTGGEVRIRVEAAGVHVVDTAVRRGLAAGPLGVPTLPMVPGREVAGIVDEVAEPSAGWLLGRRVVADLGPRSGGYAELALARLESIHLVPGGLDADAAVAMVGTGRTATAILDLAAPTADDVAVVSAAAGGIGTLLVQGLITAGATVVGLAGGPRKTAVVADLGATAVDYGGPDWPDRVRAGLGDRPVTLALDGVGGAVGRRVLELVGVGGRLVLFGSASGSVTELTGTDLFTRGITVAAAIGARLLRRPDGLRGLEARALEAAAEGRLRPVVGSRFALADAAAAHAAIESRDTVGKVVLTP